MYPVISSIVRRNSSIVPVLQASRMAAVSFPEQVAPLSTSAASGSSSGPALAARLVAAKLPQLRALCPCHYPLDVLWGNLDANRHVNNVVYYRWFEEMRVRFLTASGIVGVDHEDGGATHSPGENIGVVLAETTIKFLLPVKYPDRVHVCGFVSHVGRSSIQMECIMFSEEQDVVVAIGHARMVTIDITTGRSTAMTDAMREGASKCVLSADALKAAL